MLVWRGETWLGNPKLTLLRLLMSSVSRGYRIKQDTESRPFKRNPMDSAAEHSLWRWISMELIEPKGTAQIQHDSAAVQISTSDYPATGQSIFSSPFKNRF